MTHRISNDLWIGLLIKAEAIADDMDNRNPQEMEAREITGVRGKVHQLRSLCNQLERGLVEQSSAIGGLLTQQDLNERRDSILVLKKRLKRIERQLDGADDVDEDDLEGPNDSYMNPFDAMISKQDKQLDKLYSSVTSLRQVGTEISAEIESHLGLLADVDSQQQTVNSRHEAIQKKFNYMKNSSASYFSLYVMIVFLFAVLIFTLVGI